jgi:hypothetical protein
MTNITWGGFEIKAIKVEDIPPGQWFIGNPKFPCDKLPYYSGAIGESLFVKTNNGGLFSVAGNMYWGNINGYVIESYRPIDNVKVSLL